VPNDSTAGGQQRLALHQPHGGHAALAAGAALDDALQELAAVEVVALLAAGGKESSPPQFVLH
jgi:hypothetical protein